MQPLNAILSLVIECEPPPNSALLLLLLTTPYAVSSGYKLAVISIDMLEVWQLISINGD